MCASRDSRVKGSITMNRARPAGWFLPIIMASAVVIGGVLALVLTFQDNPDDPTARPSPNVTLGLTAEARRSLQQGDAFPSGAAGFSAYYRVTNTSNLSALDKAAVDEAVMGEVKGSTYRASPASLIDTGDNYSVVSLPIHNVDQTTTAVHLYYDSEGWVVAYFLREEESSRAWQARDLDKENPAMDAIDTTLLDAINVVVEDALDQPSLVAENLNFYHWAHPTATDFFMMANARGDMGTDTISFAVPESFEMQEVSVSLWVSGDACASVTLDGEPLTQDRCQRQFHHTPVAWNDFTNQTGHTMLLEQSVSNAGASGAIIMLVYSVE